MAINDPGFKQYNDPDWSPPREPFFKSALYRDWETKVKDGDNDYIVVVSAASKSATSGVGKTTAAICMARWFDMTRDGFVAQRQSTLDPTEFSREILADEEAVADRSAAIFDEAQGTLADQGADARRSMAQSVMDVSTALATLRYRQLTAIIVVQNTDWIDKRIDELADKVCIIQPRKANTPVTAEVFDTYYNDLSGSTQRYTEHLCAVTWEPLPDHDRDYQHLHQLKAESAEDRVIDDDETTIPDRVQKKFAQEMRDQGQTLREVADSELIDYSHTWVRDHTEEQA